MSNTQLSVGERVQQFLDLDRNISISLLDSLILRGMMSVNEKADQLLNLGSSVIAFKRDELILNGEAYLNEFYYTKDYLGKLFGVNNINSFYEVVDADNQKILFLFEIDTEAVSRNGFRFVVTRQNLGTIISLKIQQVYATGLGKSLLISVYSPNFSALSYDNIVDHLRVSSRNFSYVYQKGYVQNGTVFLDTNLNGIPDPGEPTTTTDRNGVGNLFLTDDEFAQIDVNKNDKIDLNEGRIAMIGGFNSAAEVPNEGILTAVADPNITTVTPLTSLVERMARRLLADPTIPDPVKTTNDLIQERWYRYLEPASNVQLVGYHPDPNDPQKPLEYPDPTTISIFDPNLEFEFDSNGSFDIQDRTYADIEAFIQDDTLDEGIVNLKTFLSPEAYEYLIGAQIETITELFGLATEQPINQVLDLLADSLLDPKLNDANNLGINNQFYQLVMNWFDAINSSLDFDKRDFMATVISEASRNLAIEAYQAVLDDQEPDSFRDVYRVNGKVQRLMEVVEDKLNQIYEGEFDNITVQEYNDLFSSKALQEDFDNSTYTADNIFPVDTKSFTLSIPEDGEYVLQVSDFPFIKGDTDDTLKSVIVSPLEVFIGASKGSLKLEGQEITEETEIAVEDIHAGLLTYTAAKGSLSTNFFDFRVTDGKFYSEQSQRAILDIEMKPFSLTQTSTDFTNHFLQFNGNAKAAKLEVTLTDKQLQPFRVHEIGVFTVDDEQGRVEGLMPGDAGYIQAALKKAQVVFSILPDSFVTNPTRTLSKLGNQRLGFYLVQNGTTDEVLNNPNAANKVLLGSPTPGQPPNSFSLQNVGENLFQLEFKTQGDQSSLLKLSLKPTEIEESIGITLQGQHERELVNLYNFIGQSVQAVFPVVASEAAFANTVGFYRVENPQGAVLDPLTGMLVKPGDVNYTQVALRSSQNYGIHFASQAVGTSGTWEGGYLYAPFIIANGTMEQALSNQDSAPLAYFAYIGANSDKVDHIRLLGNNTWGFEDLHGGGDFDFNDIVIQAKFNPVGS
ncbi:hypothetical protein AA650_16430 [Anabaena sp. WA102]|uniref:DUF4114 domain-containing protein n=1 Tax=Anabaena sp. WA102 TaxID=1647413 RepID=UPI0006AC4ADA|nr:DUF4114 domain-containing protein [Anabaena sp. WA102]ALB41830.1 hypothetical protein AA650_16430 [Anabaena sp. WA102]